MLDDADIEQAAAGAVLAPSPTPEQDLHVHERIIVDNAVAEAFIRAAGQARRRPACRPHWPGCRYEHHRPLQRAH
ncbi:hypothetical protein LNQ52_23825 [Klebsiella pneumoniae subsp. pneumoniae]|nr:hypothetical protein [Klebsiella pneumoniae subsp. pneumoniae]